MHLMGMGLAMTLGSSGERGELRLAAEVVEPAHQALDGLGAIAGREVVGAEVSVFEAVLEHVIGGGEHGGSNRADGRGDYKQNRSLLEGWRARGLRRA